MERLLQGIGSETAQWALPALLLIGAVVLLTGALRRSVIERRGGAVECYFRALGTPGRRGTWRIGFGRYGSENLGWFPIFSLRPRPTATLSRRGLVVVGRRSPTAEDRRRLPADVSVVGLGWLTDEGEDPEEAAYELAMGEMAMTGFLSWLESMPPGTQWEA